MIIRKSIFIRRSAADIFALHSDFRQRPLWHDHVLSSEMTSAGSIGRGSTFRTVNIAMGRKFITRETITAYDPPYAYTYELEIASMHIISRQILHSLEDGTRFTIENEFLPNGGLFSQIMAWFVARRHDKHAAAAVLELKHYLEAELTPPR